MTKELDNCPRCGAFKSEDRNDSALVCWACDTWMTLDDIITETENRDLGPMAIVGLLLEARDRMFGDEAVQPTCSSGDGVMAAGWASVDGEGMYPYCSECLDALTVVGERVRRMGAT